MIAFHGEQNIKQRYLDRVKAHAIADEIRHGFYWENGKGCAVGCTIHGSDHAAYETELGIPRILARLEDRLFENMENGDAKEFPTRFLSAIEPGADLSLVWYQFAHWLLADPAEGVIRFAKTDKTRGAIQEVAQLFDRAARGLTVDKSEWERARRSAAAAAADADAYAYAAAAYAYAAAAAAYAAADADAYAADADAYAADAAYAAYAAADAGRGVWSTARAAAIKRQADKLIELLSAAPVPLPDAA